MTSRDDQLLASYDYRVPKERIALTPAVPRDASRLLVYDRRQQTITHDRVRNLAEYLPPRAVLVVNETKVIPARFQVMKATGGAATLLFLGAHGNTIRCLSDRRLSVGSQVVLTPDLDGAVSRQDGATYYVRFRRGVGPLRRYLLRNGMMPLPPYLRHSPLSEAQRRQQYQTIFAKRTGSVAAPTASLHFTQRLLHTLSCSGHPQFPVTLHVNLGTFAPLTDDELRTGRLHEESYAIPMATARAVQCAHAGHRPIIAVGTTVVRTLESATDAQARLVRCAGTTRLFIRPGYRFHVVEGLLTNFHVPKSSLLMLVAAFVGRDTLFHLYREALAKKYRFYSFGDAMLIR